MAQSPELHAHSIIDGSRCLAVLSMELALPLPRLVNLRDASLRAVAAHGRRGDLRWQRRKHRRPSSRPRAARPVARVLARRAVWHCTGQVFTDIGRALLTVCPRAKSTDHASPPPPRRCRRRAAAAAAPLPPHRRHSPDTTRPAATQPGLLVTIRRPLPRSPLASSGAATAQNQPTSEYVAHARTRVLFWIACFCAVAVLDMRPEVLRDVSLHQQYDSITVVM